MIYFAWFSIRIMQASVWLHCSFVTLLNFLKSPQKFVLCYLSVACSQFLACFHCSVFKVQMLWFLSKSDWNISFSQNASIQTWINVVEIIGIEPMTPCLQGRCSPSWAIPPSSLFTFLVGPSGLEPPTSRLSVVRSSQLSYGPVLGAACTL